MTGVTGEKEEKKEKEEEEKEEKEEEKKENCCGTGGNRRPCNRSSRTLKRYFSGGRIYGPLAWSGGSSTVPTCGELPDYG